MSTGRSTPCVRCTGVGHVSNLNLARQFLTATCNTPDALQVHTGWSGAHRTRAQRGLQKPLTPDANHRTLSECVRCSTLAGSSTPDAEASVRCLHTQRPVSVSQRENTPATSPKISTGAIEKNALCFLEKRRIPPRKLGGRERGTHPLSTLQTPPPSQSVPTPQSVNQHVHVC